MKQHTISSFDLQSALGLYCRTGHKQPTTSNQENTMHYRRLVYNVVYDSIEAAFPITLKLLGAKKMDKMVQRFFENHKCQSAQIWKLPYEFYEYYTSTPLPFKNKWNFINELLLFEWLELEVFMMEDQLVLSFIKDGDVNKDLLIPNPEIKIQGLLYPVHKKDPILIKDTDKGLYYVSIHRDYYNKQVFFNELSTPLVQVLVKLNEAPCNIHGLYSIVQQYIPNESEAKKTCEQMVTFCLANGLILGFQPRNK